MTRSAVESEPRVTRSNSSKKSNIIEQQPEKLASNLKSSTDEIERNENGIPLTDIVPSNDTSYGSIGEPVKNMRAHLPSFKRWVGQTALLLAIVWLPPHERIFNFFYRTICNEHRQCYIQLNNAILQCMYWSVGLTLYYLNLNGFLLKYRLQAVSQTRKFNFLYMLPCMVLGAVLAAGLDDKDDSSRVYLNPVQQGWRMLASLQMIAIISDAVFYMLHRVTHQIEFLYKKVHSKHHSVYPILALDTLYFHPLDNLTHNIIPLGIAVVITQNVFDLHCHTMWVLFFGVLLLGLEDHSGYSFPISPFRWMAPYSAGDHHLRHHSHPSTNFSSYHLDWLGGTNYHQHHVEKGFKGHVSYMNFPANAKTAAVAPAMESKEE
jgi:sterol desaturase/sphingolipid hydroxylase (fatty acid hydroxylase superfamily)